MVEDLKPIWTRAGENISKSCFDLLICFYSNHNIWISVTFQNKLNINMQYS